MAAGRDNVKARRCRVASRFEFFLGTEPGVLRRTLVPDSGPGGGTVGEGFKPSPTAGSVRFAARSSCSALSVTPTIRAPEKRAISIRRPAHPAAEIDRRHAGPQAEPVGDVVFVARDRGGETLLRGARRKVEGLAPAVFEEIGDQIVIGILETPVVGLALVLAAARRAAVTAVVVQGTGRRPDRHRSGLYGYP